MSERVTYEPLELEVIEFDQDDILTQSTEHSTTPWVEG